METSMEQAIRIQYQRVLSRKRGYARAVVRYLLREHGQDPEYREMKAELPVSFHPVPGKQAETGDGADTGDMPDSPTTSAETGEEQRPAA